MGGVLIDFNPHKTFMNAFLNEEDVRLVEDVLFGKKIWSLLDSGEMSFSQIADESNRYLPKRLHEKLRFILTNWWNNMPAFPEMYCFIKELKEKGFKTYLCSNTPDEIYRHFDDIPALKLMDGIIASCDIGINKPDRRIFEALLEKYSLSADECYFIDDMPQNIEGAMKVGIKGHCYSHQNINILRDAMTDDGIKI